MYVSYLAIDDAALKFSQVFDFPLDGKNIEFGEGYNAVSWPHLGVVPSERLVLDTAPAHMRGTHTHAWREGERE